MEMDRTSGKGTYITQMSRTSREVDRTRKCIVRKSIVPDGKELGQQSKAQARLPSAIFAFFFFFRVFECFSSEFQVKYSLNKVSYRENIRGPQRSAI